MFASQASAARSSLPRSRRLLSLLSLSHSIALVSQRVWLRRCSRSVSSALSTRRASRRTRSLLEGDPAALADRLGELVVGHAAPQDGHESLVQRHGVVDLLLAKA